MQVKPPQVDFDYTGYSQRLIDHLWSLFIEDHMKPSWEKRAKEIERHAAERARLLEHIDVLQETLRLHNIVMDKTNWNEQFGPAATTPSDKNDGPTKWQP